MEIWRIDYAGMHAGVIATWLMISTLAGFAARKIFHGRHILGLWGDAAIGLVGIFLIGTLFRAFDFDLAVWIYSWAPEGSFQLAVWIDIAVTSFIGALAIRGVLRPFKGLEA